MINPCHECGTELVGRIDKKFCNDQCRSSYHNRRYRIDTQAMRPLTIILKRNRTILKSMKPNKSIHKLELLRMGFNFRYFTSAVKHENRNFCFYIYDYGYTSIDKDHIIILNQNST